MEGALRVGKRRRSLTFGQAAVSLGENVPLLLEASIRDINRVHLVPPRAIGVLHFLRIQIPLGLLQDLLLVTAPEIAATLPLLIHTLAVEGVEGVREGGTHIEAGAGLLARLLLVVGHQNHGRIGAHARD